MKNRRDWVQMGSSPISRKDQRLVYFVQKWCDRTIRFVIVWEGLSIRTANAQLRVYLNGGHLYYPGVNLAMPSDSKYAKKGGRR